MSCKEASRRPFRICNFAMVFCTTRWARTLNAKIVQHYVVVYCSCMLPSLQTSLRYCIKHCCTCCHVSSSFPEAHMCKSINGTVERTLHCFHYTPPSEMSFC